MKITPNLLSIPPYLSTSWDNIASLHLKEPKQTLVVTLKAGAQIEIPGLSEEEINAVFEAHASYTQKNNLPPFDALNSAYTFTLPLNASGSVLDVLGAGLQHAEGQSDAPALPPEVIEKIAMIAKAFGLEDTGALPEPKPNCNCMHCQVIRALQKQASQELNEEIVSDEELRFRNWDVSQTSEKLFLVTNPLDKAERYNVFLGEPLGCTCGNKNCEHIRAVLST